MLKDIMDSVEQVTNAWSMFRRSEAPISVVNEAVNSLLTKLLEAETPIPEVSVVKELFAATLPQSDFNLEQALPNLAPALVPLAVMREVMRRRGIDFCPKDTPNWEKFMDKYGAVIIAAISKQD